MAGVERPEIEIMEGEVPAAAGELAETAVPSPKASGPVGPPASPLTVVAGTEDTTRGASLTLATFPFKDEDLLRVQASRLQEANLGRAEMSAELFAQSSLLELKSEAARWHSASDQVEKDLGTLAALILDLQNQATQEGTNDENTLVKDGPLTGRSLSHVVRVQEANRNRLRALRDGENLFSFSYFSKYVAVEEGSLPSFAGDIREGNRDAVLDVIRWTTQKMSDSHESVKSMTTFLTALDAHLKLTEEAHAETSRRLIELAGAIVGVQSATRIAVDDSKQNHRQNHKTLENMLWQLSGSGKTVNQSMKDIVLSMAKLIQQSEQHLSRSTRAAEASLEGIDGLEVHLKAIAGHLQKLVDLQSKKPDEPKAAGPKMPPPPMAPTTGNAPAPGVPGGMTAPPGAVQPKLMPGSLNPPTPSAFPPSPAFTTPASFTTPAFGAGIFGTPQTPAPGATSAPAVPSAPGYKRVRLADGQWSWAEMGQGDI